MWVATESAQQSSVSSCSSWVFPISSAERQGHGDTSSSSFMCCDSAAHASCSEVDSQGHVNSSPSMCDTWANDVHSAHFGDEGNGFLGCLGAENISPTSFFSCSPDRSTNFPDEDSHNFSNISDSPTSFPTDEVPAGSIPVPARTSSSTSSSASWFLQSDSDDSDNNTSDGSPANDLSCEEWERFQREFQNTACLATSNSGICLYTENHDSDGDHEGESDSSSSSCGVEDDVDDGIVFTEIDDEPRQIPQCPFWFSFEDDAHIAEMMKTYAAHLELNKDRPFNSRAPVEFVGKVLRQPVSTDSRFCTFDTVEIYVRDEIPPGDRMPLRRSGAVLTTWDELDGLPQEVYWVNARNRLYWQSRSCGPPAPYLYAEPVFGTSDEWHYSSSCTDRCLTFFGMPLSPRLFAHCPTVD